MKRFYFVAALATVALCSALQAQTAVMTANIPFEFQVGKTQMPAGDYTIHCSRGLVTLQQFPNTAIMALTTRVSQSRASEKSVLQFHRYGDVYFLSRIWTASSADGGELPKTAREAELARAYGPGEKTAVLASK